MTPIMTQIQQWLDQLGTTSQVPFNQSLSRIQYLADALDLSRIAPTTVLVVGTNGKGSVVRLLESIYFAAGYRVAAITSPHLLKFHERLRLNAEPIDDTRLLESFTRMDAARDQTRPYNVYDLYAMVLFDAARRWQPDIAIVEAGLGGRLDDCNLLARDAVVLTTVELDHQAILGDTREAIAREKCAVFRSGIPAVCGEADPPGAVIEIAEEVSALLHCLNKDFSYIDKGLTWDFRSSSQYYAGLPMPRLKCQNAATAVMLVECLQPRCPVSIDNLHRGLDGTGLAGRFECVSEDPYIIMDVAHNPASSAWLAEQLRALGDVEIIAVVGMLKEKSLRETLQPMIPLVSEWYCVSLDTPRSCMNIEISQECRALGAKSCYNLDCVDAVFANFRGQLTSKRRRVIVVFGSFYTVAAAKDAFRRYWS